MKVLLIGANDRVAPAFARSFYQQGYLVSILNDSKHPIRFSRFVEEFIEIKSSFERDTDESINQLLTVIQQNDFKVLIPVHDTALTICNLIKSRIPAKTKILFVNDDSVHKYCNNKYELWEQCKKLEIPVPNSVLITSLNQLPHLNPENYPCIAKPVSSRVYNNGKIYSYGVKIIADKDSLTNFVREKIETVPVMVQELLKDGFGVGYNFLAKNGKVINAYAHQRINEAHGGGQSSYRKTIDPKLYNIEYYSKKLIAEIGWTGIAMIEYRIVNNVPYIMEINGRGWGSIELGIFAGCNLPVDMINKLILNRSVIPFEFTQSHYARNILNEIPWIIRSKSVKQFAKWNWSLLRGFKRNHLVEDNLTRDFQFRSLSIVGIATMKLKAISKRISSKFLPPKIPVITKAFIPENGNISIICKGNINRSAFAEQYIHQKFGNRTNIKSYGTVFEEDRLSPLNAIKAANDLGVNLENHRSRYLTNEVINKTDIFIIMDKINFADLENAGVPKHKIFLLDRRGITDPYNKDYDTYINTFQLIAKNISFIFK